MFVKFLLLRVFMALMSWGYFVPDEVWQSVEVAHKLVFGNGYLTWEWHHGLRSYLHPGLFSILFFIMELFGLDQWPMAIVIFPKILQGFMSAVGDVCMVKFFEREFDKKKTAAFAVIYATNWFMLYASSRTLVNTFETCLTSIALYLFSQKKSLYVAVISLSFMVRPTTAIFWVPLVVYDLSRTSVSKLSVKMIPQAILVVSFAIMIDTYFYGKFTIVPWNFLRVNLFNNVSEQYGVQPWHWYLTNFMPALVFGFGFYPLVMGLRRAHCKPVLFSLIWSMGIYSMLGHKEHRFIMPLIPILLAYMTIGLSSQKVIKPLVIGNIVLTVYLSLFHQSGPHWTVNYLSSKADSKGILFLTPCHGTPFYSHVHRNIPMKFLECPPDLGDGSRQNDIASLFFQDPLKWLNEEMPSLSEFDHVVYFDKLETLIRPYLHEQGLDLCQAYWHTHFPEENTSQNILIYCRQKS